MDTPLKSHYFNNLDALRFISFLGVFISHTIIIPSTNSVFLNFCLFLTSVSYFGVPFFFTLSSFLITYRLLSQKRDNGIIVLSAFYKNRILRIWPIYYILVAICFFILPILSTIFHIKSLSLPELAPFLFFYANFYMINNGTAFTSALLILWSISIEEQFYLIWAPVIKFISHKWLDYFIILLFLTSIIFSVHYLYVLNKSSNNLAIHSIYVLQNFCTGAFMAFICIKKQKYFTFHFWHSKLFWITVYIALPVSSFIIKDMILLNTIKSICYSLIIYDQAINVHRMFNAGKFKLINYLGKISYGLYIYHALVIIILQNRFHFFNPIADSTALQNFLETILTFIITCIIAHISYNYIEIKFLRLKSTSLKLSKH